MRRLMLILFAVILAVSCERRPLVDLSNTHYVRIYIDEHLKNVTTGFYNESNDRPEYKSPAIMRIALTDPETGNVRAERYLRNTGEDERGRWYDGYIVAEPGMYNVMAYNFDTESTIVSGTNSHYDAMAYTNSIASHLYSKIPSRVKSPVENEKIVYDPDHLFVVDCGDIYVPYVEQIDSLQTQDGDWFHGESIVQSYYLQVRIKGMQYVSSSVALLNGMAGSAMLHGRRKNEDHEVTIYFDMNGSSSSETADSVAVLYATFNTFGRIDGMGNQLEITFDFLTTNGSHYSEVLDITDVFETPEAIQNQWILIDKVIEVPKPENGSASGGGGFQPNVGEWEDINTDINI